MLNRAQILKRVLFLLQRIVNGAVAKNFDGFGLHLKRLLHPGRGLNAANRLNGRANRHALHDFRVIINGILLHDDLEILKEAPVVQLDKRKSLAFAGGANPSAHAHGRQHRGGNIAV